MNSARRTLRALAAAVALNLGSGSLYALGLLMRALEDTGVSRAGAALGFGVATSAFLIGVLAAPAVLARLRLAQVALMCAVAGGGALALASLLVNVPAQGLMLIAPYGCACGLMYAAALTAVRRSGARSLGTAAGLVVAAFALGSAAWSTLFGVLLPLGGLRIALAVGGALLCALGLSAALLLPREPWRRDGRARASTAALDAEAAGVSAAVLVDVAGSVRYARSPLAPSAAGAATGLPAALEARPTTTRDARPRSADEVLPLRVFAALWIGFFSIACAGLVMISQAAVLVGSMGAAATLTAVVGLANGVGRLGGGIGTDLLRWRTVLVSVALVAAAVLALAAARGDRALALAAVALALLYGAAASAYPAAMMKLSTARTFPRRFAMLFSAWGAAALLAPPLAGLSYAATHTYGTALVAMAVLNGVAAVALMAAIERR
jgi:hypothetical protein